MAGRYNGKPLIVNKTGERTRAADNDYFEIGIVMERWKLFGRKLIKTFLPKSPNVILRFGFVIQGEEEHELPEQILGCVTVFHPNIYESVAIVPGGFKYEDTTIMDK